MFGCCSNNDRKKKVEGLSFHAFPKDLKRAKMFTYMCRRSDQINVATARVCSLHFKDEDFDVSDAMVIYGFKARKRLKPDAIPSLRLHGPMEQRKIDNSFNSFDSAAVGPSADANFTAGKM